MDRRIFLEETTMTVRPWVLFGVVAGGIWLGGMSAPGQSPGPKTLLLDVGKGQLPSDTGQDDKTFPEIVSDIKELGAKALKVKFSSGDSFGAKAGANKNWQRFARFRLDAVNPNKEPVTLALTVVHGRSTNLQTRVVQNFTLKPGKNAVTLGIDGMSNVNGSAPDLTNVVRWYILDLNKKAPLVYFGDIWLEGGDTPVVPAVGTTAGTQPLIGYQIKGKVGGLDVDITVTPFVVGGAAAQGKKAVVSDDPARLKRIRAAKLPKVDKVVEFYTPEADAILSALEVFPPNNPWNLVVEDWPLHPNSQNIVASMGLKKPLRYSDDMSFVLVPPDQKRLEVKLVDYPDESDKGPAPVPDNVPIEGWPSSYQREYGKSITLEDVQRANPKVLKKEDQNSDRHAIVVDPVKRMLYEYYQMKKTDKGWQSANQAIFDLKSNKLRPDGWTSSDAAGLPIFPAVVRYDELKRGMVEHAMRVTAVKTRRAYVYPATHFASKLTDENLPRMGERIRLKKDFDISGFTPEVQAILKGLKKYGMFVADNGLDWMISVAPDPRIPVMHEELRKIPGAAFEVVEPPPGYQPPTE
jgi:hypothetical protein